jgi:hypothetical protein
MPWPLPVGWLFTGVAYAGDDRHGGRATAVACSGPGPLGGMGELILVAEELGVGLGARYAGVDGPDPGPYLESIKAYADAGFDELYIQQIGPRQDDFFTFFTKELEPQLAA